LYTQQPLVYLSGTDCRKKIGGDVCTILRVHDFLDAFGVINFSVRPDARPPISGGFFSRELPLDKLSRKVGPSANVGTPIFPVPGAWGPKVRKALLSAVSDCDGDFEAVSRQLASSSAWPTGTPAPSAADCLARFAETPLQVDGAIFAAVDGAIATVSTGGGQAPRLTPMDEMEMSTSLSGGPASKKLFTLATLSVQQATAALGVDQARAVVRAVKDCIPAATTPKCAQACSALGVAVAATIAKADSLAARADGDAREALLEYMAVRTEALEERVRLISSVEKSLVLEQKRVKLERRDLQLLRTQMAAQQGR
jgi:hypothetical protein